MIRGAGVTMALVAAAAVLLLAPAAVGGAELAGKRVAKQVAATVAPAYPDLAVGAVKCPKKIARKAGTVVVCDVDAGGYSLQFRVTQTDGQGDVTIESTQAVIPKARAEELVRNNATLPAVVDCGPDAYIVRPPGFPFSCTAQFSDGTVQQVTLSPTDVAGNTTITQVL